MKKKALLSSILVIVMCVSIIAGSTLALFTNEDDFDITLTSGKVDVDGYVDALETYSVTGDVNGTIVDENGNTYSYVGPLTDASGLDVFTNTGTAQFDGSVLTIDRITPGDKVKFEIRSKNTGNVAAQTRFTIDCLSGFRLMEGLVITVYNYDEATSAYVVRDTEKAVDTYTSIWTDLPKDGDIVNAIVEIELPVAAGNEYQDQSTEINVLVEAVQFNGVVENEQTSTVKHIEAVEDAAALQNAINNPDNTYVLLTEDIASATITGDISSKVIDADGHDTSFVFYYTDNKGTDDKTDDVTYFANFDNVTIKNLRGTYTAPALDLGTSTGTLTIADSNFVNNITTGAATNKTIIRLGNAGDLSLSIDNCDIAGGQYALYCYSIGDLYINDTTFENTRSWALQINGATLGNVAIENCEFRNCTDGLLKVLSGVDGNFTFVNNVVDSACKGHDGRDDCFIESTSKKGTPIIVNGTVTFFGNVDENGADWAIPAGNIVLP